MSLADVLVDPLEALGREGGAGRADGAQAREVAAAARLDAVLHAGGDVGGAGAEAGDSCAGGEVPEHAHVRVAGAAVVEDDRGGGQQRADEEVPHHPAGGREPEDAVALARVDVEVQLLELLQQDPAVPLDDRLRQAGGPRRVEDPEGMVEGDALEAERRARAELAELPPGHRRGAAVAALQGGQVGGGARDRGRRPRAPATGSGRRSRRRSRAGRSPCRRSGSRPPRRAPSARSARSGRRRSRGRSRASRMTRSRRGSPPRGRRSGPRGRSGDRRRRGRRGRRPGPAGPRRPRRPAARSSPQRSSVSSRSSEACTTATSSSALPRKTCSA